MLTSRTPNLRPSTDDPLYRAESHNPMLSSPSSTPSPSASNLSLPIFGGLRRRRHSNLLLTVLTTIGLVIILSVAYISTVQLTGADASECRSIYMFPSYARVVGFDSTHTKFASKYNLYLYREQGKDPFPYENSNDSEGDETEDTDTKNQKLIQSLNGIPVLFIPGNAGSYKQVRSIAAEAANIFFENKKDSASIDHTSQRLDFYAAHFNEDFTAFHGRTMLDQAEYMNDAIKFILSLYQNQKTPPSSVILIGHSMGGVVARVILTLPNYQEGSVNTILTLAAPHAAAPATFDGDIMRTYAATDKYWRTGFKDKSSMAYKRLHDVSLISITGGMPDTILPADYTTLRGLVPDSNGFTVYSTGIPSVWTTVDHLAIVWCDQIRKVIASTLFKIIEPLSQTKTKPLEQRMKIFRRSLLSGFEESTTQDYSSFITDTTLRLKLKKDQIKYVTSSSLSTTTSTVDDSFKLMEINKDAPQKFSLLSSLKPDQFNPDSSSMSVLLCKDYKSFSGRQKNLVDLGSPENEKLDLECIDVFEDAYKVPNSLNYDSTLKDSSFGGSLSPFYAIQMPSDVVSKFSYVVFHDAQIKSLQDFTRISLHSENFTHFDINATILELLWGASLKLSSKITTSLLNLDVTVHSAWSSLLSYTLTVKYDGAGIPFNPMIRQYINDPFETKWHLQLKEPKHISFHGIAPFIPFENTTNPLHLELWNPSASNIEFNVKIDILRSLRLLILRYRLAVASFPIFIIVCTLFVQVQKFNSTGVFPPFRDGLAVISNYAGLISGILSLLSLVSSNSLVQKLLYILDPIGTTPPSELKDYHLNTYFLGLEETYLCIMGPLFFVLSLTLVHVVHIMVLMILHYLVLPLVSVWSLVRLPSLSAVDSIFLQLCQLNSSIKDTRRFTGSIILCMFVMFYIPYQFAYMVACSAQIIIVVRAYLMKNSEVSGSPNLITTEKKDNKKSLRSQNIVNYHMSLLMLMIWLIPVNLPVLIVFFHNMAVRWETPFSSHHNILAILPIILLIGRHVQGVTPLVQAPGISSTVRKITYVLLGYFAFFSLVYGIRHLYWLHYLFNLLSAWFFVLTLSKN
ncbi:hypothetical protein WICPIJ_006827 [Wickerhamomyces pijperi]|uniref:GPI inositol-deacylase n=1 Tax=Wickerhamomyces pijperi TaxID=599730 RepID=A0A9P8TL16_WICPI|nr:hypothetical protein WICPIJ_006827 [Wickerhamomyces pijperi]